MTAIYPATLPPPTVTGYGLRPEWTCVRTEMDTGPARTRRRVTQAPTRVPVNWLFSTPEHAVFEAWFDLALAGGADWFAVDLYSGLEINAVEARFTGAYSTALTAPRLWTVTAELEARALPRLTAEELEVASTWPPADLTAVALALCDLIHKRLSGAYVW